MKKFLIYSLTLFFSFSSIANAVITTDEQFSEEYVVNHGYSYEMARLMNLNHKQIMGEETAVSENVHVYRPYQNCIRKFLMYLDPGLDDEKFMQHDIKYTVRWDSL